MAGRCAGCCIPSINLIGPARSMLCHEKPKPKGKVLLAVPQSFILFVSLGFRWDCSQQLKWTAAYNKCMSIFLQVCCEINACDVTSKLLKCGHQHTPVICFRAAYSITIVNNTL